MWAMCTYGVGMGFDLVTLPARLDLGGPVAGLGTDVMFPIAGLLTIIAMYQYPTTARTRGERITVGMDAGIVLLGSAVFIWYFSVSLGWTPEAGLTALLQALLQPVLTLVTGFAVLKIAYVGAGVIGRRALMCFGASVAITVLCGSVPASNRTLSALAVELGMLAPLVALAGAVYQCASSSQPAKAAASGSVRRWHCAAVGRPASRCCSSTWTTSRPSTTRSATPRATPCCRRSRAGSRPTCVPGTRSAASAVTSSS